MSDMIPTLEGRIAFLEDQLRRSRFTISELQAGLELAEQENAKERSEFMHLARVNGFGPNISPIKAFQQLVVKNETLRESLENRSLINNTIILGALDTLGTALAEHGHTWTEGERTIYEQAVALMTQKE